MLTCNGSGTIAQPIGIKSAALEQSRGNKPTQKGFNQIKALPQRPNYLKTMDAAITFLQQLAKRSKDLTFVYDLEARCFTYLSDSAINFFGLSPQEIYKSPEALIGLLQEEDRQHVLDQVDKLRQGEAYVDIEFRLMMADSNIKWLHAKVYTLYGKHSHKLHMAGILEDITTRKEHEISLYTIKEQKDTVLQILGHDLRGPLHTISGATELIHREIGNNEAAMQRIHQYLTIISSTCEHSLGLINEVLSIEYIETQKVAIKSLRFDLVERIHNQIETYRLIRNSSKNFNLNSSREKIYASMDPTRYMLIIENLLSNAYKFTKADGQIEISVTAENGTVQIKVADNGIGIPEALKPFIFDKFTKARRPGHQGERPVGLGMHLIKTMVEQLEGKIWFESQEGIGTTFFVELPKA